MAKTAVNLTAAEDVVYSYGIDGQGTGAAFQFTGTWAGVITFEAKIRGAAWTKATAIMATNAATLVSATTITSTGTDVNGIYRVVADGLDVRARMSTYTSGTCVADSADVEV